VRIKGPLLLILISILSDLNSSPSKFSKGMSLFHKFNISFPSKSATAGFKHSGSQ